MTLVEYWFSCTKRSHLKGSSEKGTLTENFRGGGWLGGRRPSFPYCSGGPEKASNEFDLRLHIVNFSPNLRYWCWFFIFFYQIRGWSIFITGPSEPGDRWCNLPPINFQNDKRALFEYKSAFFHDENQLLTSLSLFNSGSFKVNLLLTALFYYFSFASIGFTFNYLILKNAFVS